MNKKWMRKEREKRKEQEKDKKVANLWVLLISVNPTKFMSVLFQILQVFSHRLSTDRRERKIP